MPGAVENFDLEGFDVVLSSSSAYVHGVVTNLDTTHICYYHSQCDMLGIILMNI